MDPQINLTVIFIIFILCALYLWARVPLIKKTYYVADSPREFTLANIIEHVKKGLYELSTIDINDWSMNEESWNRKVNVRAELKRALKGCAYGDRHDKAFVKSHIRDLILAGYPSIEEDVNQLIPFNKKEQLTTQDLFEIVMYLKEKEWGDDALERLIEAYQLDRPKSLDNGEDSFTYEIIDDEIKHIFNKEFRLLTFEEKLDIVVQRVYQMYKGFSVIDIIREQRIDGVSGGVSGITSKTNTSQFSFLQQKHVDEDGKAFTYAWDSVWIFYKGKSIHLSFLSFGSEHELKRVCHNIYKYNLPGQLSEANGFKVNEMKDGSRVVVVRPPFAESWAFFIRKFDVSVTSLEHLIQGGNAKLPVELLKFLMKGSRITAVTGSQGAGKTTLMMALVKYIYASYTLRVQEMSFELNLRRLYSSRNIVSFKETDYVSGQVGLDLQKKTDGTVNIVGEIATDEVAAWMIQTSQVASLFTIFSHHAKSFADLISSLRNSLLKTGMFRDEKIAEMQVASVIDFNVHLKRDIYGRRYIERISECCPAAYLPQAQWNQIRSTESELLPYEEKVVVEYRDGKYVAVNPISDQSQQAMFDDMVPQDQVNFRQFIEKKWEGGIGA